MTAGRKRDWVEVGATVLLALAAVATVGCLLFLGTAVWIARFPVGVAV